MVYATLMFLDFRRELLHEEVKKAAVDVDKKIAQKRVSLGYHREMQRYRNADDAEDHVCLLCVLLSTTK